MKTSNMPASVQILKTIHLGLERSNGRHWDITEAEVCEIPNGTVEPQVITWDHDFDDCGTYILADGEQLIELGWNDIGYLLTIGAIVIL